MIRVGFCLDKIQDGVRYDNPLGPNPGIGGTQYMICQIAYYLARNCTDNLNIYLYSPNPDVLPEGPVLRKASSCIECVDAAALDSIDFLVVRGPFLTREDYGYIDASSVKTILWSHNFENIRTANWASRCRNIVCNVCVSQEQLDLLLDHELGAKSICIHNAVYGTDLDTVRPHDPGLVCYVGNLLPGSGYEEMLKAWKIVRENCSNARLRIIGGKSLYRMTDFYAMYSKRDFERLTQLEKEIILSGTGEVLDDVEYRGVVGGLEKCALMAACQVGVANLTPAGDTFGLSVAEFQALGVPVVSKAFRGVRETVNNNATGILVSCQEDLAGAIIRLLTDGDLRRKMSVSSKTFIERQFSLPSIAHKWEQLFCSLAKTERQIDLRSTWFSGNRFNYDGKQAIRANAKLRSVLPFVPSTLVFRYIPYGCHRLKTKILNFVEKINLS